MKGYLILYFTFLELVEDCSKEVYRDYTTDARPLRNDHETV